jgi:hypothetical protein
MLTDRQYNPLGKIGRSLTATAGQLHLIGSIVAHRLSVMPMQWPMQERSSAAVVQTMGRCEPVGIASARLLSAHAY